MVIATTTHFPPKPCFRAFPPVVISSPVFRPESSFCQQRIHGNPVPDPTKKGQREHGRFLRFPHNKQESNVIRAGGAGKQKRTQARPFPPPFPGPRPCDRPQG